MIIDEIAAMMEGQEAADPAVVASLAWTAAHSNTLDLCLKQQRLEARLMREGLFSTVTTEGLRAEELVYSEVKAAEEKAAKSEQHLLENVANTPAVSLVGVIAKLAVISREAEDNSDLADFPVRHVKSALSDLLTIVGQPASNVSTMLDGSKEAGLDELKDTTPRRSASVGRKA
ncbi:MAG: hypothetical protein AB7P20_20905 [Rhizobiaceae bacterium]